MFRLFSIIAAALMLGLAVPAGATEVDFGYVLTNEDGVPVKDIFAQKKDDTECDHCPPMTLGLAAAHALVMQLQDEHDLDPLQKWARGVLAMKVRDGRKVEISVEEAATIKRLIGKVFGSVVIMQAFPMLDPSEKPPPVK